MRLRCTAKALVVAALAALAHPALAADAAGQVLALVNQARAKAGCPALTMNAQLTAAAYGHAKAMATQNFFSHTSKNGAKFTARIKAQGYHYTDAAENIGMGYTSARAAFDGWMASSGHRRNILDCVQTETGIAMYDQPDDIPLPGKTYAGRYYWVEVFARP